MTNHHWLFSIKSVQKEFGLSTLLVVNDFNALAMALPFLNQQQKYQLGTGHAQENVVIGLVGAGTGLDVSGLIRANDSWTALDSEGGHTSFAPRSTRETAILKYALQIYDHVSSERLLSGAGLQLIYRALATDQNIPSEDIDAPEIMARGLANACPLCRAVLDTFCEVLGTVAGNLALTLGAKGGVYIGGGIVPRLGEYFNHSGFRERFEQRGRFTDYLRQVPTFVITEPFPAFTGISVILAQNAWQQSITWSDCDSQYRLVVTQFCASEKVTSFLLSGPRLMSATRDNEARFPNKILAEFPDQRRCKAVT
ncbi:glucokinase [Oxalobacteraceae bacterium GrIS 1.18]